MAKVTIDRLMQIPLMAHLTREQVESLLPRVEELPLSAGQILFRQGEPATHLYFVEKGIVSEVEQDPSGQQKLQRYAGQGQYLGRYGLVTGRPFRVTAIATEDTTLLAIPLRELQPILFCYVDWRSWFFHAEAAARMRAMPIFARLDDWEIYRLADQAEAQVYKEGEPVYQAGAAADYVFAIDQGQVMETVGLGIHPPGNWPLYLSAGNYLGQASLMGNPRYETTAIARKKTRLYRIPGQALRQLLADKGVDLRKDLVRPDVVQRLRDIPIFSDLSKQQLRLLAGYTNLVLHRPGDIVSRQGEPATALMILDEGEAIVRRQIGEERPRPVAYFKAHRKGTLASQVSGQPQSVYFGDHALLAEEMRGATVEVTRTSAWIVLDRSDFGRFLLDAGLTKKDLKTASQPEIQTGATLPPEPERLSLPFRTRRHWYSVVKRLVPPVGVMALVALLSLAGLLLLDRADGAQSWIRWISTGLLVISILWSGWRYIDWRNDFYEVTSQAVVHIEKTIFVREERYEAPLDQIQNVNIEVDVPGRLLGYGDLSIDTAAARGQVEFRMVPSPADVQRLIQEAAEQAKSGQRVQFRESIRQQLEDQLYPERLKPDAPATTFIEPEQPPSSPTHPSRLRSPRRWLPRFEIREADRVTWRKHWLNLVQRVGTPTLITLLLSYVLFTHVLAYLSDVFGAPQPVEWPPVSWLGLQGWLFLVTLVLWFFAGLWMVYQYVDWRNDVYIVTDNDVIDVERDLAIFPFWFFYTESRRQAALDNVQYVDFKIPNLWAILLNYGDVIVRTAGLEGTLDFLFVSNPRHVQAEILRRLTAFRERQRQREFEERWGSMAEWFETYRDLSERNGPGHGSGGAPHGLTTR